MKRVARTTPGEPVVPPIPRVVEPIVVELALRTIPVEHEDVQVAVRVAPLRTVPPMPVIQLLGCHCPSNTLRVASYLAS